MTWINTWWAGKKLTTAQVEESAISKKAAPKRDCCAAFTAKLLSPFEAIHKIYGTYCLIKTKDLVATIKANVSKLNPLSYVSWASPEKPLRVVTAPKVAHVVMKQFRNDPKEGDFTDLRNLQVFLPILKDLFPADKPTVDDFLLTCSKEHVASYREPILAFVGPQIIQKKQGELLDVVAAHRAFWSQGKDSFKVDADSFVGSFTTAVISRVFLRHPGPFETYQKIHAAIGFVTVYSMIRRWSKPTEDQMKKYNDSIKTIQEALNVAFKQDGEGTFVHGLRSAKLSELKIKTTLLVMFFGGSETTATLLKYAAWRLGQHPDLQKQLQSGQLEAVKFLNESLRLCPPAFIFGRQANKDFQIEIGSTSFRIEKGENLLAAPFLMGRDPDLYADPATFNPHRKESASRVPFFGVGEHLCPGQWLAKAEAVALIESLVEHYTITSTPSQKELTFKGFMTLRVEERVELTLTAHAKRKDDRKK